MTNNTIHSIKIHRIINECKGVKTFLFNIKAIEMIKNDQTPKPGQFLMIWVPGVDEIPMSISGHDIKGNWSITVKNVGECTNALHELRIGDYIGVRGPLGNSFKLPTDKEKKIFLIGGGIGMAPLKFLASELAQAGFMFNLIEGVKTDSELMFIDEFHMFEQYLAEATFCTDDGSYGEHGFTSDIFENTIKNFSKEDLSNSIVYTCGPEIMMYKVFQICEKYNIELYASLERTMRCGCGLCGLCALDPSGQLVCKDGPVFDSKTLSRMEDFGKKRREFSGKKILL